MQQKNIKKRYSTQELGVFETIITKKLAKASSELKATLEALGRKSDHGTDVTIKMHEDGAEVTSKESLGQLAVRQEKFIAELKAALLRIKNGTYGICIVTGELIDRERLAVVPHTRHSLAAKLADRTVVR